jgi:hypothetical protein
MYSLSNTGTIASLFMSIGYQGNGTLNQTGGTVTVTNIFYLGESTGTGAFNLSGGLLAVGNEEFVGNAGTGTFMQTGGTNAIVGGLQIGQLSGSTGMYSLSNTGTIASLFMSIGYQGNGTLNQTGGTITVTNTFYLGESTGTGLFNLSGGLLSVANEFVGNSGTGTFMQTGGSHNVGTLYVGYNSGSKGTYVITNGSLTVTNSLTVNSNSLFTGTGVINGLVNNNGSISPGYPLGTLTVNGNYSQTAAGALNIVIGGMAVGTQYSQLTVTGAASLNGSLNISVSNGFAPNAGNQFTILKFASGSGTFSITNGLYISNGLAFFPVYSTTNLVLVVSNVPPPNLNNLQSANGSFSLTVSNLQIGEPVMLQTSTNLVNWTAIQTNIASGSMLSITNPINLTLQSQFFRAVLQ